MATRSVEVSAEMATRSVEVSAETVTQSVEVSAETATGRVGDAGVDGWIDLSVFRCSDSSSSSTWRDGDRRNSREPDRPFTRSSDRFSRDDRDQDFGRARDDKTFMTRRYDDKGGNRNGGGFTRNAPPREEDSNKSK
jgi:hypothetical protein